MNNLQCVQAPDVVKFILNLTKFVIDSHLLISLAALSMYVCTVQILDLTFNVYYACFIFLATLATYNIPVALNGLLTRWQIAIGILLAPLLLFSGWQLFKNAPLSGVVILSILIVITFLYYFLPGGKNFRRIPYLKIFIISTVWSAATVLLPVILNEGEKLEGSLRLMGERFLFIFAITVPFDIRDLDEDRKVKLRTIPQKIGVFRSLVLSGFLLILYLTLTYLNYGADIVFYSRLIVVIGCLILLKNVNSSRRDHFYTGLVDGTMVLQGIVLWCLG